MRAVEHPLLDQLLSRRSLGLLAATLASGIGFLSELHLNEVAAAPAVAPRRQATPLAETGSTEGDVDSYVYCYPLVTMDITRRQ